MKPMKLIWLLAFFLALGCNAVDTDLGKPDNYVIYESSKDSTCGIYSLIFKRGDCVFLHAMSGPCENIEVGDYVTAYQKLLNDNDSLLVKRGRLVFQYHSLQNTNDTLLNLIVDVSKSKFKTYVSAIEVSDQYFILQVSDK